MWGMSDKPGHNELCHALSVIGSELDTMFLPPEVIHRLLALELIENEGEWVLTPKGASLYRKLNRGESIEDLC